LAEAKVRRAEEVLAGLNGHRDFPAWVDSVEFLAEPDPDIEWLIPGLIERQSRTILAGIEEGGKSLLTLILAAQAAVGHPILERFPMERPIRVVYFDLEMGRRQTRRRLRQINETLTELGKPLQPGALELFQRPDGMDLNDRGERRALLEKIERLQPDLMIFDPLYKMMATEGYEREVKPFLRFLDRIRRETDVAMLLVHHLRKRAGGDSERGKDTSDIYGSSLLLRWPETILSLTYDFMKVSKDRDYVFRDDRAFPVLRKEEGEDSKWLMVLGNPRIVIDNEILEYLTEVGPASANLLARDLGHRRLEVSRACRRLAEEGRVEKTGAGSKMKWEAIE
jgi:hypothetical protein